ncbi:hypothetical protein ACFWSF_37015 [Streptomyces sp. NPDC058611]
MNVHPSIEAEKIAGHSVIRALTCCHSSLLDCPTFRAGLRDLLPEG